MEAELKSLEVKINQLVELCQRLRTENQQVRQELASALNDNKRLHDKIDVAAERLEQLLEHIPQDEA